MAMTPRQKRSLRSRLLAGRQRVECHYCGTPLGMAEMTLDHVHARSKGGHNSISNILPACLTCNRMKGALDYEEFISRCKAISAAAT